MVDVLKLLTVQLDGNTRTAVRERADGLMRGVRYESEKQSSDYVQAVSSGWTIEKLEVICDLNAFYQIVLGSLASVARGNLKLGLVRAIPIAYGEQVRITPNDAHLLHVCHSEFKTITQKLGIDFWCLQSASAQDILYNLAHRQNKS